MERYIFRFFAISLALILSLTGCGGPKGPSRSPRVKNIILVVGDGMGLAQVSALALSEDDGTVNMERASVGGFVKTHSDNNRVTDSAASATAYSTGEKTTNGYLGVSPAGDTLETILEKAERAGLATGLVATTHIMHATPGAFYTHTPDRNDYEAIALDLITSGVNVAIGGGINYLTGRADGRNLIEEAEKAGYTVVDTLPALEGITHGPVMALYDERTIPSYLRTGRDPMMLARGTTKALDILTADTSLSKRGFFLMVEGSWIDSAGHGNDSEMLIGEMIDLDNAVGVAFDYADANPGTLVIVLADHETGGLTIPAGNENFLLPDSGIEFQWSSGGHTATMVPMFAYGAHAELFGGIMDNTEVNRRMVELLGLK